MSDANKQITMQDLAQMFPIPDGVRLSATLYARSDDELPIHQAEVAIVEVGMEFDNILHIKQFESFIEKLLLSLKDFYGKPFRQMNNQELVWVENETEPEEENEEATT